MSRTATKLGQNAHLFCGEPHGGPVGGFCSQEGVMASALPARGVAFKRGAAWGRVKRSPGGVGRAKCAAKVRVPRRDTKGGCGRGGSVGRPVAIAGREESISALSNSYSGKFADFASLYEAAFRMNPNGGGLPGVCLNGEQRHCRYRVSPITRLGGAGCKPQGERSLRGRELLCACIRLLQ